MRVAFTGSRSWNRPDLVRRRLQELSRRAPGLVVIHGACPLGVDKQVDQAAKALGIRPEVYPAEWDLFGWEAGGIRNRQMLKESRPELLIAFFNPLDLDKPTRGGERRTRTGTLDAIEVGLSLGIPVEFHTLPVEGFTY